MLNELIRGKYKAVSLYISDDYQALHQVPQEYIRELVQGIEIEFNVFRHSVFCALTVNHALIKNTVGKEPDRLNDKNIFRIVIIDSQDFRIDRTFICINAERTGQGDRSGDMYELLLEDIYGYYLEQITPSTQVVSYKGTPLSVLEQLVEDSFKMPDEILRSYNIPVTELNIKKNTFGFLKEPEEITFKCIQNKGAIENIRTLCKQYNLYVFNDLQSLCITENLDVHNLPVKTANDGSPLFSELANSDYEFKIGDKVKQPKAPKTLENMKISISKNSGGKSQETETLDFNEFIRTIELNNNADELLNTLETREVTESSGTSGIQAILWKYTFKYIMNNNLAIYCSCCLSDCNPGSVASVELRPISGFTPEKAQGDKRYSGNWYIFSTTVKIIGDRFITRLILCRFDNPKDDETTSTVIGDSPDTSFPSSKPPKPKKSRLTENKAVSVLEEFAETVQNATGDFLGKIQTVNNQMQSLSKYADQKIESFTAPIKMQFVNQIQSSEIVQKAQNILSKNRRTLGLVNNILRQRTGVDLFSAVRLSGEIMNIDSIVKDQVLGQVNAVTNTLTTKTAAVIQNTSSLVSTTISNAAEVMSGIDQASTNAENLELNLDQALDTVEKAYNAIQTTKRQIDTVKNSVDDLKETVKNIPNAVKAINPLDTLKAKREQLLNSVRLKKS